MSLALKELRAKSDEEIIALHDNLAQSTSEGVNFYLNELTRRDQSRQTEAMLSYTKELLLYTKEMSSYTRRITWMTGIVTLATIINLVIAFRLFCR